MRSVVSVHPSVSTVAFVALEAMTFDLDILHISSYTTKAVSRGELGRFWEYNNFHLRIALWKLLRPPVACYAEAAFVRPRATCL